MSTKAAVIVDVVSIQKYIFQSNRLKHNIGASFIVYKMYEDPMYEAFKKISLEEGKDFTIVYKGGGNALILFKDKEGAVNFIKEYSLVLMEYFPGLIPAFGMIEDFDDGDTRSSLARLHEVLRANKSKYFPNVNLQHWGITKDCVETFESAEVYKDDDFISKSVLAKEQASEKAKDQFDRYLGDNRKSYKFPMELSRCSMKYDPEKQREFNPYVGLVHIDGNRMGERFRSLNSLEEVRNLSDSVKRATEKSLESMLGRIIELHKNNHICLKKDDDGKYVIPMRPIVLGGDDITFVCDAELALELTQHFIKTFSKSNVSDNKPLNACAGVFIFKAKYPFYRAYMVVEDLIKEAKKRSREKEGSYISFAVLSGGFTGDWEHFARSYYQGIEGNVRFSPYSVDELNELFKISYYFKENKDKKWPSSKLHKLKELLFDKKEKVLNFVKEQEMKFGLKLPEYEGYEKEIWKEGKTPYFDAIEIIDFLPSSHEVNCHED